MWGFKQPFPSLTGNVPHRIVFDYTTTSGAAGMPDRWRIGTIHGSGESRLRKGMSPGQGEWYYTQESGGTWVDTLNDMPRMAFFVDDWAPNSGAFPPANTRGFPVIPSSRSFPIIPSL